MNHRRQFLVSSAAAAIGATGAIAALGSHALASDPIERNGTPKFKFSLAAYSYRSLLTGDQPELTLFDFIDDCAKFGLDGTELTSYYFEDPLTDKYLVDLRGHAFRLGLDISGTAIRNDFCFEKGPQRDREIETAKGWIDHAARLGAPVIRIFAGKQKEGISPERTTELVASGIEECCEHAGSYGVHLALENHGGPTATAAGLLEIVKQVESPWFGVNLDTGNFHSDDPYAELAQVAPFALNVQVKVVTSGEKKGDKKPTDFARINSILRDSEYRGYVVLEYEEEGDPRSESERYLDILRESLV